jgi:hypothetical protein
MIVGTLLLPALLTGLDAFFRARRRRVAVSPWFAWVGVAAVPVVAAWIWLRALGAVGVLDAPPGLAAPGLLPVSGGGAAAVASAVVVGALACAGARLASRRLARRRGSPAAGGLAAVAGLVIGLAAALAWVVNPYLAALLLPAAHLWLFAGAPQGVRGWPAVAAVVAGLLAPLLVALYYGVAFAAGPLEEAWLLGLGTAGGHVSVPTLLVAGAYIGALAGIVRVVTAQWRIGREAPPDPIRTRGPVSYAGPGSLGGTDSALRR